MTHTVELCHAFVLHSRPYREKSRLVELWTMEYGRISGVMRQQVPPLFQPCLVAWRGKNALKTIYHCECVGLPLMLVGDATFAGFYLNELLVRLLTVEEPQIELFALYTESLAQLNQRELLEPVLRRFERCLLGTLGYAFNFHHDVTGQAILADKSYFYYPEEGFVVAHSPVAEAWQGRALLAIAQEDFSLSSTRQTAKLILRRALAQQLGTKPLKSRELWQRTP
jgi:DNA repair protein RecO (recombination protein O)